jgi:integrase
MRRTNRLTQRICETSMPTEVIGPSVSERTLQRIQGEPRHFAHKQFKGAVPAVRDGKNVVIRRTTKWLVDGNGLALVVSPGDTPDAVRRSWIFRWNPGTTIISKTGRARRLQKVIGLGALSQVPLQRARELADMVRRQIQEGRDPLLVKRSRVAEQKVAALHLKTLRVAMTGYFHAHSGGWNPKHAMNWKQSFDHLGSILDLPCARLDRDMVVAALTPLWTTNPDTARRLSRRLFQVLGKATAERWRSGENPADWQTLKHSFTKRTAPPKHHDSFPYKDASGFMEQLRRIEGVKARALELLILTGVRTNEIRTAKKEEFDLDAAIWTVPAEKTKTGKNTGQPHIVSLSRQAVECLRKVEMKPGQLVFPIHEHAMKRVHRQISKVGVPHGWRSTLSTFAGDMGYPREIAESVLDHLVGGDVERRYRRTVWQEQQSRLLQAYSDFLSGNARSGENVVQLERRG